MITPLARGTPSLLLATLLLFACRAAGREPTFEELARRSLAQIEGEIALPGLTAEVEVLRDRWGVPHVYAQNTDDLFFAQGFVQAQDRLWQMEMYRRTGEGRLSEILGESALRHDRLARLVKFRGPYDGAEWTSYHPEGRRIFEAFSAGVNAFIEHAADRLPVEFVLTGIRPEPWTPEVPLMRLQTAMPLGDARSELRLAEQVAELGAAEANRRARPQPWNELTVPAGVEMAWITDDVQDALGGIRGRMPEPELLPQYAAWADALRSDERGVQEDSPGSNNWAISGARTASGEVIVANDPHRSIGNPSIRYIVHLVAPGWNVIGATEPPLPGVMIGHNGRVAWGLTIVGTDQSDVYVETVDPERNATRWRDGWQPIVVETDTIRVKGDAPVVVHHEFSRHGPIFYRDSVNHRAYAVRSTMHEPGTAGYLGALRLHAVQDCREFLDALAFYKAPTENMVCGDADGNIAWQASALSPKRNGWYGRLPVPGTGAYEWDGFRDDLPRELNPERGWIATANHDIHPVGYAPPLFFKTAGASARFDRLSDVLSNGHALTLDDMRALQHDAYSASAAADLPLFQDWTAPATELERARAMLAGWDASYRRESAAAALYSLMRRELPPARRDGLPRASRDSTAAAALQVAVDSMVKVQGADWSEWRWGRFQTGAFPHPLVSAYDLPDIERTGGSGTVAAAGATFREIIDFANLDGSLATNVPGQSAQPGSPFYGNLLESFSNEEYFPLLYTREAVEANTAYRLKLVPRR